MYAANIFLIEESENFLLFVHFIDADHLYVLASVLSLEITKICKVRE